MPCYERDFAVHLLEPVPELVASSLDSVLVESLAGAD